MRILLFGATGMVGQGVLRECLRDPEVQDVYTVGRRAVGLQHPKLHDMVQPDLFDYTRLETQLTGFDACFFCLGVSSAGMREAEYTRVTYGITLAAAESLVRRNPAMTFVYVSGMGTDSTEQGRVMWARVKGKTENALLRLPFKAAYMFRPGLIQPLHGIQAQTRWYRIFYTVTKPVLAALRQLLPAYVTTTERVGRAMLVVAKHGATTRVLESRAINAVAAMYGEAER